MSPAWELLPAPILCLFPAKALKLRCAIVKYQSRLEDMEPTTTLQRPNFLTYLKALFYFKDKEMFVSNLWPFWEEIFLKGFS